MALKLYLKRAKDGYKELFRGIGSTVDFFFQDLQERFEPLLQDRFLCLATFLNPRFKHMKQRMLLGQITEWVLEHNEYNEESPPELEETEMSENFNSGIAESSLSLFSC